MAKEKEEKIEEEKNPASSRIGTHDLLITRCGLYRCASTTTQFTSTVKMLVLLTFKRIGRNVDIFLIDGNVKFPKNSLI